MMQRPIKVWTLNCNGLNGKVKAKRILTTLHKSQADILFLQETHWKDITRPIFNSKRFSTQLLAGDSSKSRGVALLISSKLRSTVTAVQADPKGRFLFANMPLEGEAVTVASLYAPNDKPLQFLDECLAELQTFRTGPIILGGDLNCFTDRHLDHSGPKTVRGRGTSTRGAWGNLHTILAKYGLTDVWRHQHQGEKDFTYFSSRHSSFSRIDYLLVSDNLLGWFLSSDIGICVWSDHANVEATFYLQNALKTKTPWRLNPELLLSRQVQQDIKKEIEEYFSFNANCGVPTSTVWDAMKAVVRGRILAISSAYRKKEKVKEGLLATIARLEREHKITCSSKIYKELQIERKKLETLEVSKIKRNVLYLRQKFWLKTPKALKLLAWKVKERQSLNQVHAILDAAGKRVTLTPDIVKTFQKFYSDLYTASSPLEEDILSFLQAHGFTKQLSLEHAAFLDEPIAQEEVMNAISRLKNNKSPGSDGYGAEFYKAFAPQLTPFLVTTFNDVLETGTVPSSWNEATVVVIPKEGRDPADPRSYRPISLLNQDHKLFTAILTGRLNKIIAEYIGRDQAGFIPGRNILDNVLRTLEVIHYCKARKEDPSLILSLDVEKAFDRVEHSYIVTLLKHMKFGSKFLAALQAIYASPKASVKVNGHLSDSFPVTRGTRQGCPLSPLLFALAIEPLAEALRTEKGVRGIRIGQTRHVLSLFAEDMVLCQRTRNLTKGYNGGVE